jgi:histidyl-tRNA synthetase
MYKILRSGLEEKDVKDISDSGDILHNLVDKCLRYDLTLPLIRYVCNNFNNIIFPFKRYQVQPVFRADRPQKGRFREFYQCDIEIIGTDSLLCEIELLQVVAEVFKELGIKNYKIKLNNRGLLNDITKICDLEDNFTKFYILVDKIDKIGLEKFFEEIKNLNIKEDKFEILKDIYNNNSNLEYLSDIFIKNNINLDNLNNLKNVYDLLKNFNFDLKNIIIDFTLARGLGYYTDTIFEVILEDVKIGSVVGGGRYDYFAKKLNNDNLKAIGLSFGIDRLLVALEELNLFPNKINKKNRLLVLNTNNNIFNVDLINKVREDYIIDYYYNPNDDIKKQMKFANKKGYNYVLIDNNIKDMISGEQCQL